MILLLGVLPWIFGCNDPGPVDMGMPSIRVQDLTIEEGDDTRKIFVDIRLDKSSDETVLVKLHTQDGSAEAGEDFVTVNNASVEFPPGTLVVPFGIDILGDRLVEPDENFSVQLSQPVGAELETAVASITLLNDDVDSVLIPESGYTTPESYPGMQLVWSDDFNASELDATYWTYEVGTGCPSLCGWGNNELEYYRPENTYIKDGHLVIEAREEQFGGRAYTSSRIITRDKFDFRYGRVDIRAALPKGKGLWPALWMLGSNIGTVGWPACGEIDIMEMIGGPGGDNVVHGTAHWANAQGDREQYGGSWTLSGGTFNDEFHVFSLVWTQTTIKWYLNDIKYHEILITDPILSELKDNSFYFIFNVAVGGDWPGPPNANTEFPQRMIVDYIRVFQ
jgi:beta-glucanase (GH16 family)